MTDSSSITGERFGLPRLISVLLPALLLCVLSACAGSQAPQPAPEKAAAFELDVLPESFSVDPAGEPASAKLRLRERALGEMLQVELHAVEASGLKALYYRMHYDAAQFSPVSVMASPALGPLNRQLVLSVLSEPGTVHAGQLLLRPQDEPGLDGAGLLATVVFARRPFDAAARSLSAAPASDASRTTLSINEETLALDWRYFSSGDYFQNSEVNIADLTPIGQNFNLVAEPGPLFDITTVQSVVDGDGNGLIGISDLTPIGANFNNRVLSYNVYSSNSFADVPADNAAASSIEPIGFVNFAEATGDTATDRLAFSFPLEELKPGWFYWVRPCDAADGAGSEGTPSTLVSIGGNEENEPPAAALSADPLSGEAPLTVSFDASASTDSDGSVVQFSFDFDGDGSFEQVGASPLAQHEYLSGGSFDASVLVTDDGAAVDSASVEIAVTTADNLAPVADLTAEPNNGNAPLSVTLDASASTDPNGDTLTFEWDFEGDGTFDATTGTQSSVQTTYSEAGAFEPQVRVTDTQGLSDNAAANVDVGASNNQPPVATLEADVTLGEAPLEVTFTLGFTDLEADTELEARFDKDGDGNFETFFSEPQDLVINYPTAGLFTAQLEVEDSLGAIGSDSLQIAVSNGDNVPPVAELFADPDSGDVPVQVFFTCEAEDVDGTISKFEWDFDNDDVFELDTGNTASAQFTYVDAGLQIAYVRVTDNDGGIFITSLPMLFSDPSNEPPVASFSVTPDSGSYPLTVTLDASSSSDPDGTVESYSWDLNGDGFFELFGGEELESFEHTLTIKGATDIRLEVIDNDSTRSTSVVQTVTLDSGWFSLEIDEGPFSDKAPSVAVLQAGVLPTIVRLGVVYNDAGNDQLLFIDSELNDPQSWTEPVVVSGGLDDADASLALVSLRPAVAFQKTGQGGGLSYLRASDTGGDSWGTPLAVHSLGFSEAATPSLALVGGQPAIACGGSLLRYFRSTDATGGAWGPAVELGGGPFAEGCTLRMIDAKPAIAWFSRPANFASADLFYIAASDANGAAWGSAVDCGAEGHFDSLASLFPLNGLPAVGFTGNPENFIIAENAAGSSWQPPVDSDPAERVGASFTRLAVLDGLPCLVFRAVNLNSIMLQRATDLEATNWLPSEPVAISSDPCTFIVFKGEPVVVHYHTDLVTFADSLRVTLFDDGGA